MNCWMNCCFFLTIWAVFSAEVSGNAVHFGSRDSLPLDKSLDGMVRFIENSRFRFKRQLDFSPQVSLDIDLDPSASGSDSVHRAPAPAAFNIESSDCTGLCKSRTDDGTCELDAGCCSDQFSGPSYLKCIVG